MTDTVKTVTAGDFPPGKLCTLQAGDEQIELEVVEATELTGADSNNRDNREPFSLILRGDPERFVDQGMYEFSLPDIGELTLFVVPLGPSGEEFRYEVIFN